MSESTAAGGNRLRSVGVATGLTLAAFVGALAVGVVYYVPVILLGYDPFSTNATVGALIATQVGFVGVGALYVHLTGWRVPIERPTLRTFGYVISGAVLALVVANGLLALIASAGLQPESVLETAAASDPLFLLALAAFSMVLIAPIEEFVFRGLVQGRLRQSFGPVGAIAGASLLFGSMHLLNYSGTIAQIVAGASVIVCVGAVFGALYEKTDNLLVPALAHGLYNVALAVSSYLAL